MKNRRYLKIILLSILFCCIFIFSASALILNSYLNKINKFNIDTSKTSLDQTIPINKYINDDENNIESTTIDKQNDIQSNHDNETPDLIEDIQITYPNTKNKDIKNIALFGIDGTEGTIGRSDCILIATIDSIHNQLKLSSIIRDSYVDIPNRYGKDKINHAYAFGGPELALQTLNNNFNLNITKFASVNFSTFPKVIDSIGGITLNITDDELNYINKFTSELNSLNNTNYPLLKSTGIQTVNGTQALAYARIRYTEGGDFERSHRQRIVINAFFEKAKSLSILDYPKLLNEILPSVNTNLANAEILSLCLEVNSLKDKGFIQDRFPKDEDAEGKLINGVYYYVFDEEDTIDKIHKFIYDE